MTEVKGHSSVADTPTFILRVSERVARYYIETSTPSHASRRTPSNRAEPICGPAEPAYAPDNRIGVSLGVLRRDAHEGTKVT
jgi:hypothetical protein